MKRRWVLYLVIGILFGVIDFVHLGFLNALPWQEYFGDSSIGQSARWFVTFIVLNIGLWLVPVVPAVLYEAMCSGSRLRPAVVGLVVWWPAIVAYYLTNAAQLAVWGIPTRPELHISNRSAPYFLENWASVLQGDILGGILEYTLVAVIGGAIVGFLVSSIYLHFKRAERPRAEVEGC